MAKNSKIRGLAPALKAQKWTATQIARAGIGVLVLVNIALAFLVMNPPGGSAESLDEDIVRLQGQIQQAKAQADVVKKHAESVTKGRTQADDFLNHYFVTRRTLPTTLITELYGVAQKAGIKDRGNAVSNELIDGSDTLGMVTITWNFEGTYKNLLSFVREIDRSDSLLIIDSLNAAPQTGSSVLQVAMKLNAFIREDGSLMPAEKTAVATAEGAQGGRQ